MSGDKELPDSLAFPGNGPAFSYSSAALPCHGGEILPVATVLSSGMNMPGSPTCNTLPIFHRKMLVDLLVSFFSFPEDDTDDEENTFVVVESTRQLGFWVHKQVVVFQKNSYPETGTDVVPEENSHEVCVMQPEV
jgi:hypothetical protein